MECESCGRYRPSREVAPAWHGTRMLMSCARCRRLVHGRILALPAMRPIVALVPPR